MRCKPNFIERIKNAFSLFWGAIMGKYLTMSQFDYVMRIMPKDPMCKKLFNTKRGTVYQFQVTFSRNKKRGTQWG